MIPTTSKVSLGEETLALHIKAERLPEPVREYRFAPPRRWRFDFAWPALKIAVEVDGGTRGKGGHTTHKGITADHEKRNAAVIDCWRVLVFTTEAVKSGRAIADIKKIFGEFDG